MANLLLFIGGIGILEMFLLLILLGLLLLWLNAVLEIVMGDFKNDVDKIVWLILVLAVPAFGVILYYLVGRRRRLVS